MATNMQIATAKAILQVWLERTYPGDIHISRNDLGYYAANDTYDDRYLRAQLRYYGGFGSGRRTVTEKLQAAANALDALNIRYEWHEGNHEFKYLLVTCVRLPRPTALPV